MSNFLDILRPYVLKRSASLSITAEKSYKADFLKALMSQYPSVIAEIKFHSPSLGQIYTGTMSVVEIAKSYQKQGAAAISVLTEPDFFKGNVEFIRSIHQALPNMPILLKDFVLSTTQIKQAQQVGASAILLIVNFLTVEQLQQFYEYALSLHLLPVIEVHNEAELEIALTLNPSVIGINARNLETLQIDLSIIEQLVKLVPAGIHVICESGITTSSQMKRMADVGCKSFLIGTHFMQNEDPGIALDALLRGDPYAR